jgi:hypothetical protein
MAVRRKTRRTQARPGDRASRRRDARTASGAPGGALSRSQGTAAPLAQVPGGCASRSRASQARRFPALRFPRRRPSGYGGQAPKLGCESAARMRAAAWMTIGCEVGAAISLAPRSGERVPSACEAGEGQLPREAPHPARTFRSSPPSPRFTGRGKASQRELRESRKIPRLPHRNASVICRP